jgi:transaldolase
MAKKENALDLAKLIDKGVRVKLSGGREGEQAVVETIHAEKITICSTLLK